MIYRLSYPKPNMQFAFYVYVDGDSSVTIIRPGSGTIVYDFFVLFIWPVLCLCMLTAFLFL